MASARQLIPQWILMAGLSRPTHMNGSPASMTPHFITAGCLYAFDALVSGQGVFTLLVAAVMVLIGFFHLAASAGEQRWRVRHGVSMVALYIGLVTAVFSTIYCNNRIARARADTIIAALTAYKAKHGDYPTQLEALVPEHLPSVPRAKYALGFAEFGYYYDPEHHDGFLMYTSLPPFGRPTYSLARGSWGYID